MRVALCSNRDHGHSEFVKNVKARLPNVDEFFPIKEGPFERAIYETSLIKQRYELDNKIDYDLVIYISADATFDFTPKFEKPLVDSLYGVGKYSSEEPECWFHNRKPYVISTDFFYCDTNTYTTIGLFNKFKRLVTGERPIPRQSEFYTYLFSSGIFHRNMPHDE